MILILSGNQTLHQTRGGSLVDWARVGRVDDFSSTGRGFGFDMREVDAFRSAVRDTFLGVSGPPVRSDDVRGKQFSPTGSAMTRSRLPHSSRRPA
jgi:hypothetical protein